jgi:hypothetical protein
LPALVFATQSPYSGWQTVAYSRNVMRNAALTWLTKYFNYIILEIQGESMEILTWNLQFCFKKDNSLWKKLARNLVEMDFDFILLQEINPYFIYDKKYKIEDGPVHYFKNGNKNIYYHELKDVLSVERPYDNFWGTVIITNEKYKIVNNHFYSENVYIGSEYFGHESLMSYDFELDNGNIITLMNFYKKGDTSKAIYDENGNWTPQGKDYDYEKNFFSDIKKTRIYIFSWEILMLILLHLKR